MRIQILLYIVLALMPAFLLASDQVPAPPQDHPIALVGGTVHTVSGDVIENGTILFVDGKITAIGTSVNLPAGTESIDVAGKHIYPSLIVANTSIGLVEVNAVRATRDYSEVGDFKPEVRSAIAYNTDSELIPVSRANGIGIIQSVPLGGVISGTSSVMMMDGWTYETTTLKGPSGVHLNWPRMGVSTAWWMTKSAEEQLKERDKNLAELDQFLAEARAYHHARKNGKDHRHNTRLEAMVPVLDGSVPLYIHANEVRQIQAALDWTAQENLKMILVSTADACRVAGELAQRKIPVILTGTHTLPRRRWEDYDTPFTAPKRLSEAGVTFCIASSGSPFAAAHIRNIPFQAGTAAAYGLPKSEALKSVTLYPAQILGIDKQVGSLEIGKDATLIVCSGDPLEIMNQVEMQFIQGRKIDLNSRHTQLYEKYQAKYKQLKMLK